MVWRDTKQYVNGETLLYNSKPGINLTLYKILNDLGFYTDRPKGIMQSA
jgi:hypothetical protein